MKSLLKFLPVVALACTCSLAYAQTPMKADKMAAKPMHDSKMMKDCVMMKGGKMIVMKGGKTMTMDKEMAMTNGTKVMTNGSVMMSDGTKMMMANGDCVMMDGAVMKGDKMMNHEKTTHDKMLPGKTEEKKMEDKM